MNLVSHWTPNLLVIGLMMTDLSSCGAGRKREVTEEIEQTHPLPSDGRVMIANARGFIQITGWEHDSVKLAAVKRAEDQPNLESVRIEVVATNNQIAIRTSYPESKGSRRNSSTRVDYTLSVPRRACLEEVANGDGDIFIKDVAGNVIASTVNGSVMVQRASGDLKLSSVNGKTEARLNALAPGRSVELATINGSTVVLLPADAGAELAASVVNGSVGTDFPLTAEQGFPAGAVLEGQIGQGGARVSASTVNGSVWIGKQR